MNAACFFLLLIFTSCVKYSPYEVDVDESERNQTLKNIQRIQSESNNTDTITFAFIGDTQRFYDESVEFVEAVNKRNDIDFVVISGDLTDFGLNAEFIGISTIFNKLDVPYLTVIGNHDLVYNGEKVYTQMFGELDYTFSLKGIKFIMLNTNSREYGFDGSVPNIPWLNHELSDTANYKQAVVIGHVPQDHKDFDANLEQPYVETLAKWNKTLLSMSGHVHKFEVGIPYDDGVHYLYSYSVGKSRYTVVKIWSGGFQFENQEI